MNVLVNIRKRAQFNRTYEPLEINNLVRAYVKKTVQTKNRDPRYSKEVYKIIGSLINEDYLDSNINTKFHEGQHQPQENLRRPQDHEVSQNNPAGMAETLPST